VNQGWQLLFTVGLVIGAGKGPRQATQNDQDPQGSGTITIHIFLVNWPRTVVKPMKAGQCIPSRIAGLLPRSFPKTLVR
jgi:hypothetical protein